jgi:cytochrome c oxidase subunit IV
MSALTEARTHSVPTDKHEHHSSLIYWVIWIALLILTVVTYLTGRMHMPTWGIFIAMAIATLKATLVVLFFMHLWEQKGVNRVVMVTALIMVGTMLMGTFADVFTRLPSALPRNVPTMTRGVNANPPADVSTAHGVQPEAGH